MNATPIETTDAMNGIALSIRDAVAGVRGLDPERVTVTAAAETRDGKAGVRIAVCVDGDPNPEAEAFVQGMIDIAQRVVAVATGWVR